MSSLVFFISSINGIGNVSPNSISTIPHPTPSSTQVLRPRFSTVHRQTYRPVPYDVIVSIFYLNLLALDTKLFLRKTDHLADLGVNGRIIFKWIFKTQEQASKDLSSSKYGQVAGSCEHGNEPLSSINERNFIAYLSN